ncbi:MAG: hypothetical protein E6G56_05975 [Actinobacteria bacterium]|nr:MAG: hypothetical protein E6G56_05975 [Actinomycetota bacterium]
MRKPSMAVLIAAVSISLAGAPAVADAAGSKFATKKSFRTLSRQLQGAQNNIKRTGRQLSSAINAVSAALGATTADLNNTKASLAALVQAASAIPGAFSAIQSALTNPVTGLVGLNNARPLIGGATCDTNSNCTAASGSEFSILAQAPGGVSGCPATHCYLLRFNRLGSDVNVSQRAVNVTPVIQTAGSSPGAVNCAASVGATNFCSQIVGYYDNFGTDEYVTGSFSGTGWQIAAIAG